MSDSVPAKPPHTLKSRLLRRLKWISAMLVVLSLVGFGAGVYFFGYPVSLSVFQPPLAERLGALESSIDDRIVAQVGSRLDALGLNGDRPVGRAEWSEAMAESMDVQGRLQRQIDDLQTAIDGVLSAHQDGSASMAEIQALSDRVAALQAKVDAVREASAGRMDPSSMTEDAVQAWAKERIALTDAFSALTMASIQIQRSNKEGALEAYQQAEWALASLDSESFKAIKETLAVEAALLAQWPAVDWLAWEERVQGVLDDADAITQGAPSSGESMVLSDEARSGWWQKLVTAMNELVTIRPREASVLSEADELLFKTALQQHWVLLEMGMANRDIERVHVQAVRIRGWMMRMDRPESPKLASAEALVDELIQLDAPPPPEGLGQTRQAIRGLLK